MIEIEIKVSGPGLVISHELYFIAETLRQKGYNVKIKDEHPPTVKHFDPLDLKEDHIKSTNITMVANHLPWGG